MSVGMRVGTVEALGVVLVLDLDQPRESIPVVDPPVRDGDPSSLIAAAVEPGSTAAYRSSSQDSLAAPTADADPGDRVPGRPELTENRAHDNARGGVERDIVDPPTATVHQEERRAACETGVDARAMNRSRSNRASRSAPATARIATSVARIELERIHDVHPPDRAMRGRAAARRRYDATRTRSSARS